MHHSGINRVSLAYNIGSVIRTGKSSCLGLEESVVELRTCTKPGQCVTHAIALECIVYGLRSKSGA